MNLNYRGVPFEYEVPEEDVTVHAVDGLYRGLPFSKVVTREDDLSSVPFDLSFRGVTYHRVAQPAVAEPRPVATADVSLFASQILDEVADLHQKNILERLQRRIQSAEARGDETLVHQLEAERRMIAH